MQNLIPAPRTAKERARLLNFTPVPRACARSDGWTPERQRAFIDALADTGCVTRAAKRVNMATEGAYALRRHPKGKSFEEAWERAQDHGVKNLTDIAIDRIVEGVPVPIFYKGEQIGERRYYNDRLMMFILRHHDPDRYGSGSPAGRLSPATVRKLRAEWEHERAEQQAENGREVREALVQKMMAIHERLIRRVEPEGLKEQLDQRTALGLYGPPDPLNKRPPIAPEIPSPWAKPGYEYPRWWEAKRLAEAPHLPAIRSL